MTTMVRPRKDEPVDVVPDTRWMKRGACVNAPLSLFISPDTDDIAEPVYPSKDAVALCDQCPVKPECLAWALETDAIGTWAGTSDYQRALLKRKYSRKGCPSCASNMIVTERGNEICLACGVSWYA